MPHSPATFVKLSRLSAGPIAVSTCPKRVSVWGHSLTLPHSSHFSPLFLTHTHSVCRCFVFAEKRQRPGWQVEKGRAYMTRHSRRTVCPVALYLPQLPPTPPPLQPWPRFYLSPVRVRVARLSMFITAVNLFVQLLVSRLCPLYSTPLGHPVFWGFTKNFCAYLNFCVLCFLISYAVDRCKIK